MQVFSISTKYIGTIYARNLTIVLSIFVLIFAIIDSMSADFGFLISVYRSIINLDMLFAIICGISTIITLLRLKQTNQDIALISLDKTPMYIFNVLTLFSMLIYTIFITIIHPFAFAKIKRYQILQQNQCIFESGGKFVDQNNQNIVNKIKYDKCQAKSLEELEISFDNKHNIRVEIYSNDLSLPKGKNSIVHTLATDNISFETKNIKNDREIRNLNKVDMYKKDLKDKQISIYHMIYSLLRDNNGVISTSDIVDSVLTKIKNALMIVVFINSCYFILITSKRGFMVTKVTIKTIIFIQTYYIITYLISEKLSYSDSILIKISGFALLNIFIIAILRYIQSHGFLNIGEIIIKKLPFNKHKIV
ncbi:hypothetical protein [Candidatus Deianiraea vastatrix]|uniref:Uncharacterized protein n=1 Tax=Candidatus Deianiraea vastatrix TaxID=2163644 RepID=A0A5B8XE82_9RICK|nr:hypothetical protein [Candidatus Deianiraea vastatrix]QED23573.1 hypothetical protein Deia_00785 [Candidatus Deianiraea vastatrix]